MDPLSITTSIIALTGACLKVTKSLSDLREKYRHAQLMLAALCSESTVICTTLSQIQTLLIQQSGIVSTQLSRRSELLATFDVAITGCTIIFSVLDEEVQKLSIQDPDSDLKWTEKAKYLWNETLMNDLLHQLRGQQHGVLLVLQAIQLGSVSDIHQLLIVNTLMLERIASQTRSLRTRHPSVKAPNSILDVTLLDSGSILGTYNTSATDTTFLFDDLIVNSKVYRRVLAQAGQKSVAEAHTERLSSEEEATQLGPLAGNSLVNVHPSWEDDMETFLTRLKEDDPFQAQVSEARKDKEMSNELKAIEQWFEVISDDEKCLAIQSLISILCERIHDTRHSSLDWHRAAVNSDSGHTADWLHLR